MSEKTKATSYMRIISDIGGSASSIISSVLMVATGVSLDSLVGNVKGYIGYPTSMALRLAGADVNTWDDIVEERISADYAEIVRALKAGIGQGVGGLHSSLYENLLGTGALLQSYQGIIHATGIDPVMRRYANTMFRANRPDAETAWFMHSIGAISFGKYMEYFAQDGWDIDFIDGLENSWIRQPPIDMLLNFKRRGRIDDATLKALLKWYRLTDTAIDNVAELSVQYPEPYRTAEMHSKGIVTTEHFLATTRTYGLDDSWANAWSEAQRSFPDFATALALLRRGDIDESNYLFWMLRNQFDPSESEVMLKLKEAIPPIQDLIRFAVREAYGDHKYEAQYPAMVANAKKMGLTEEAAGWYWYAHWDRIPITLMYANYHRGLWDKAKLETMLRIVDMHPDDREDIINVAYVPPTVRELGYGFDVGAYTIPDIVKYRRWGGLSPEDAEKSGQAMVLYRTEAEREAVRRDNMRLYSLGRRTKEQFEAAIKAITPNEAAVKLWLERGELEREIALKPTMDVEGRIVSSSEAITAFKLKLRDESWLKLQLKALDWTDDRIDTAVERAKLEMARKEEEEVEVKYRKLTLAQLSQMYKLKVITKEQMTTEIILIGYTADDAELLSDIYTREEVKPAVLKNYTITDAARLYHYQLFDEDDIYDNYILEGYDSEHASMLTLMTILNFNYPILTALYEKGQITLEDFRKELIKLGMDEWDAKYLADRTQYEFQVSRVASEKELTKAEILKGAKNNILTINQSASLLQDIGYDQNEAYYLLAINKVVAAGDPEGYWDMRRVTENYKKAMGEKAIEIPDELIMLEKEQRLLKGKLEEAKKNIADEVTISDLILKLGAVETQMKTIIASRELH